MTSLREKSFVKGKILVIRMSAIGDVVLATGALRYLLSKIKSQQIIWLGSEPSLSLLKKYYPGPLYLNYKEVKDLSVFRGVDLVFDLQRNLKSYLLCLRLKYSFSCLVFLTEKRTFYRSFLVAKSFLLGRKFDCEKNKKIFYQHQLMLKCVTSFFKEKEFLDSKPNFSIEGFHDSSPLFSIKKRYLGIATGASFVSKKAPVSLLVSIIDSFMENLNLLKKDDVTLVFLGDRNDVDFTNELLLSIKNKKNIYNLTGKSNLVSLPLIMSRMNILLTNDSGLLHIAEAVGTPVCALFGPTSEDFGFRPFLKKSRAYSSMLGCRPCSKHGKKSCRYDDWKCFSDIDSQEVKDFLLSFY